ncbi:Uncharacterized [Syntrophomonas zehnderi OL-4]|uniref:Uncharacterized n=1 Tax=Syntrophomonas zehnderi OL-4 TaxID=690567 RepID=A0A0E4GC61_9FIRM|nr:Uncharacterized [Syntrophomonas zehnderi OL-4]
MPEILDLIEAAQQGNERAMENLSGTPKAH